MNLNQLANRLIADVLFDDDPAAAATLAEILTAYDFDAHRVDTDVHVHLGGHQVLVTGKQIRTIVAGATTMASEPDPDEATVPITVVVRAQLHLLVSLLQEVADCGRMHALLEVPR